MDPITSIVMGRMFLYSAVLNMQEGDTWDEESAQAALYLLGTVMLSGSTNLTVEQFTGLERDVCAEYAQRMRLNSMEPADLKELYDNEEYGGSNLRFDHMVLLGWTERTGMRDGQLTYRLTDAGKAHVEMQLLPEALAEQSGKEGA